MKALFAFVFLMAASSALAEFRTIASPDYPLRPAIGIAWYHDHRFRLGHEMDPVDAPAVYVQFALASIGKADLCFGGLSPIGFAERSRPLFSVSRRVNRHIEVGAYWAVSPYTAAGLLIGRRF